RRNIVDEPMHEFAAGGIGVAYDERHALGSAGHAIPAQGRGGAFAFAAIHFGNWLIVGKRRRAKLKIHARRPSLAPAPARLPGARWGCGRPVCRACRLIPQVACSATIASGSVIQPWRTGMNSGLPLLPMAMARLRFMPAYLM